MKKIFSSRFKNISLENKLIVSVFLVIFIYLISNPPIISFDTIGYLKANIKRYPGYTILMRGFKLLFNNYYEIVLVGFQLLFSFFSIFIIFKNLSTLFNLNIWLKILLFIILIFPFFPPLSIANNLASEGLAYPLYLLLISFSIDLLFRNQIKKTIHIAVFFILLNLTRGQFFIISPILALLFFLKNKNEILRFKKLKYIIVLISLPFITNTIERTFKKMVYGYFVTSPYTYVNIITLPLFTSKLSDSIDIKNEHYRNIFVFSYNRIDSLGLLSSKIEGSYEDKYMVFHKNFPKICNQNIEEQGEKYFNKINGVSELSTIQIEQASKEMLPILVKNNFKEWILIYFEGVKFGFYSIYLLIFYFIVFIYSGVLSLKKYKLENYFLFLSSLLIFSNSMIVGVACHSIMRYLVYNYFLAFIIIIILFRKTISNI